MRSRAFLMFLLPVLLVLASVVSGTPSPEGDDALLGRWDITAWDAKSHLPINCWLELTRQQGVLKGRFNEGSGAVFDLPQVAIENRKLTFMYPEGHPPNVTRQVWQAALKNGALAGTADVDGQKLSWTGERGPLWPTNPRMMKPGAPLDLFNGKDVSNWLCQDPHHPMGWFVKDGILMNVGKDACNIYTRRKFNDFKLDVEFNVDPQSNSGVYLRGRYEIQILDGYRRPMDVHSQGALYGFIVPSAKADKPAGEWQRFEITFIANHVTVIMNGTKIIDNGEVPGITGGALDAHEKEAGPIMLQGDHGRVRFRKVRLTPLN